MDPLPAEEHREAVGIIDLPPELLEKIFSFLSYETTSNIRLVCRAFERASRHRLNRGFAHAERFVQQALKTFRSLLPRRESERREHPLSRRVDHLAAVETRLGLLSMTYRRYMDADACCFIPGKVLDEVFQVVQHLKEAKSVERSSVLVLQELRDISSMAMEHFEEHIVPGLKRAEKRPRPLSLLSLFAGGGGGDEGGAPSGDPAWPGPCLNSLLTLQRTTSEARNKSINVVEHSVAKLSQQVAAQRSRCAARDQTVAELRQQVSEQAEKLAAQDLLIADLVSKLGRLEERLRAHTGDPPPDGDAARARKRTVRGPAPAAPAPAPATSDAAASDDEPAAAAAAAPPAKRAKKASS